MSMNMSEAALVRIGELEAAMAEKEKDYAAQAQEIKALREELEAEKKQSSDKDSENDWIRKLGVKREEIVSQIKTETESAYHLEDSWHNLDEVKKLCDRYFDEKGDFKDVPLRNDRMTEKILRDLAAKDRIISEQAEMISQARVGIELALMKNPGLTFPDAEVETLMRRAFEMLGGK